MQIGIIPARYGSSRLPGKPLLDICGEPMIVRTAKQVKKSKSIHKVVVATDDETILNVCKSHKIDAIMTNSQITSGRNHELTSEAVSSLIKFCDECTMS